LLAAHKREGPGEALAIVAGVRTVVSYLINGRSDSTPSLRVRPSV
jgi:hypothetical protein